MLCLGASVIVSVILLLMLALKRFLAGRVVRSAEVRVAPWPARPSATQTYHLKFTPGAQLEVNSIVLVIEGRESVVVGHGTRRRQVSHLFYTESIVVASALRLERGVPAAFEREFTLPFEAPPSMSAASNQIKWYVETYVDIPNWPDWDDAHMLHVAPRLLSPLKPPA